jgi:hypothetical protein
MVHSASGLCTTLLLTEPNLFHEREVIPEQVLLIHHAFSVPNGAQHNLDGLPVGAIVLPSGVGMGLVNVSFHFADER